MSAAGGGGLMGTTVGRHFLAALGPYGLNLHDMQGWGVSKNRPLDHSNNSPKTVSVNRIPGD